MHSASVQECRREDCVVFSVLDLLPTQNEVLLKVLKQFAGLLEREAVLDIYPEIVIIGRDAQAPCDDASQYQFSRLNPWWGRWIVSILIVLVAWIAGGLLSLAKSGPRIIVVQTRYAAGKLSA